MNMFFILLNFPIRVLLKERKRGLKFNGRQTSLREVNLTPDLHQQG